MLGFSLPCIFIALLNIWLGERCHLPGGCDIQYIIFDFWDMVDLAKLKPVNTSIILLVMGIALYRWIRYSSPCSLIVELVASLYFQIPISVVLSIMYGDIGNH